MTTQTKLATVARVVASAPVVSPLTDLLQHRSTIVFIVGVIALLGLPFVPGMTPERLDMLTNVVIGVTGVLGGRFTIEGVMKARATLSQLQSDLQQAAPQMGEPAAKLLEGGVG